MSLHNNNQFGEEYSMTRKECSSSLAIKPVIIMRRHHSDGGHIKGAGASSACFSKFDRPIVVTKWNGGGSGGDDDGE